MTNKLKTAAERSAGALWHEVLAEEERDEEMATALDGRMAPLPRAREQASKQTHTYTHTHISKEEQEQRREEESRREANVLKREKHAQTCIRTFAFEAWHRGFSCGEWKERKKGKIGRELYCKKGEKQNIETNERVHRVKCYRTHAHANEYLTRSLPSSTRFISLRRAIP